MTTKNLLFDFTFIVTLINTVLLVLIVIFMVMLFRYVSVLLSEKLKQRKKLNPPPDQHDK